jgi:hypothetical protein
MRSEGAAHASGDADGGGAVGLGGIGCRAPMNLPGSPHVGQRGDVLFVEDCALEDLARRYGTPLYVYSRAAMLGALSGYQRALDGRDH